MELKEIYRALNKIRYIAISDEIRKHDLRNIDNFIECFFKIVSSETSHFEAYLKMEEVYYEKYGENKFSNYESFKSQKSKWTKKKRS